MKKLQTLIYTLVVSTIFFANHMAHAAYTEKSKSINMTAETLPKGEGEVGLLTLAYGLSDRLQLTVPTLPWIVGNVSAGLKYKFELTDTLILSPTGTVGFSITEKALPAYLLELPLTIRLSNSRDLSFGVMASFPKTGVSGVGVSTQSLRTAKTEDGVDILWYANLDTYRANGDLWYIGLIGVLPNAGYVWAWEHFHVGVGLATVLPYAYFYWRF